jgi:hypothetical protein
VIPEKVIIDTDIGDDVDNAFAPALALSIVEAASEILFGDPGQ